MDEFRGNTIARNFSSEYFNYTINFIISKEFPTLTDFPDFSLVLCDLDKNIELAKIHNLPAIALSHEKNQQESLMDTPWLILDADALSPFFLQEVYCRHYHLPLTITTTNRCIIQELTMKQLPELILLQEENKDNPSGCFFPQNCSTTSQKEEFLLNYIKNQYTFYGYGIYGIFHKENTTFLGIAGFSPLENIPVQPQLNISNTSDTKIDKYKPEITATHPDLKIHNTSDKDDANSDEYYAEIGYSILKKFQRQGIASEVLPPLLHFGKDYLGFTEIITRIEIDNIASIRLARKNNCKIILETTNTNFI